MSVTIKDVAKKANVAPSTVSRVISDHPSISDKTKKRVRKIMDDMGYFMNYSAQTLAQKSTKTIGIVMKNSTKESLHSSFFPEVIRGISAICSQHDFSMSLTTGESEKEIFEHTVKMVRGKRVDGLIVLYSKADDKVVPYLVEYDIPFVVIGQPMQHTNTITHVDNDNIQAAKDATEYLIQRGHQAIGFIGDDSNFEVVKARQEGYTQAMQAHNFRILDGYVHNMCYELEQGKNVINQLMALPSPPTGLVVTEDMNALIVLSACIDNNIRVPEDMSVISFNNSMNAKVTSPPLTSVDVQIFELGYEAANCLLDIIKDPNTIRKSVIIPTIIKERASCATINGTTPQPNV